MKKKIIIGSVVAVLIAGIILGIVLAMGGDDEATGWTVTFETGGGNPTPVTQRIQTGGRVNQPVVPSRGTDSLMGWLHYYGGEYVYWNFQTDFVQSNVTLIARWRAYTENPVEAEMADVAFSNTLEWYQGGMSAVNQTTVYHRLAGTTTYTILPGTITYVFDGRNASHRMYRVSFTPTTIPAGDLYNIRITTIRNGSTIQTELMDGTNVAEFLFQGEGTLTNPYLVAKTEDVRGMIANENQARFGNAHFLQIRDISTIPGRDEIIINHSRRFEFSGVYNGANHSIFGLIGDGGLFHTITATGIVRNLRIDGRFDRSATATISIGGLTDDNSGLIENVTSHAVTDELAPTLSGIPTPPTLAQAGTTGTGGIAGINRPSGIIRNSQHTFFPGPPVRTGGIITGRIGAGGIAAFNLGLIENARATTTMPAGNQANTANTVSSNSFVGGIAGVNFGTIRQSVVLGRVFSQSTWAAGPDQIIHRDVQRAFGGIVGYNAAGGVIEESRVQRNPAQHNEFRSKAQTAVWGIIPANLGVASIHADADVGGLAGINNGTIRHSFARGVIVGGRDRVGALAGAGNGTIENSFIVGFVGIVDNEGLPVAGPTAQTTFTIHRNTSVAPSTMTVVDSFHVDLTAPGGGPWASNANVATPADLPTITPLTQAQVDLLNSNGPRFRANGNFMWEYPPTTVQITGPATSTAEVGDTFTLTATALPADASQDVVWSVNNPRVIHLGDGVFQAALAGEAIITASAAGSSGVTAIHTVTVENAVSTADLAITFGAGFLVYHDYTSTTTPPTVNNVAVRPLIVSGTQWDVTIEWDSSVSVINGFTARTSNNRGLVNGIRGAGGTTTIVPGFGETSITFTFSVDTAAPGSVGNVSFFIDALDAGIRFDQEGIFDPGGTVATLEWRFDLQNNAPVPPGTNHPVSLDIVFDTGFVVYAPSDVTRQNPITTPPSVNNATDRPHMIVGTTFDIIITWVEGEAPVTGFVVRTSNNRASVNGVRGGSGVTVNPATGESYIRVTINVGTTAGYTDPGNFSIFIEPLDSMIRFNPDGTYNPFGTITTLEYRFLRADS